MAAFDSLIGCTALLILFYFFLFPFLFLSFLFLFSLFFVLGCRYSGTLEAVLGIAQFSQGAVRAKKATDPFLAIMWIGWLSPLIWKLTILLFPIWGISLAYNFCWRLNLLAIYRRWKTSLIKINKVPVLNGYGVALLSRFTLQ